MRKGLTILLAAALTGCSGGKGGVQPSGTLSLQKPAASGDSQTWSVGHTLPKPLRVAVLENGRPAPGVVVEWHAVDRGVMSPASSVTDDSGIAVTRWTLSTVAGEWTAQGSLEGAAGSPVTYTATSYPNFPFQLSYISGSAQSGAPGTPLSESLLVRVGDEFDNPYTGGTVNWSVISGSATLSVTSSTSGTGGVASCDVVLGLQPGQVVVRATLPGAGFNGTVDFTLTAL